MNEPGIDEREPRRQNPQVRPLRRGGMTHFGVGRWLAALAVVSAVVVEAVPVYALLALFAFGSGGQVPALPLWNVAGAMLAGWALSTLLGWWANADEAGPPSRAVRVGQAVVTLAGWACVATLASIVSPLSRISDMSSFAMAMTGQNSGTVLGLGIVTAYLWWRGLALARTYVTRERVYRRLVIGFGVLVVVLIGATTLSGRARSILDAQFALLLPLETIAGLMGLMAASVLDTAREQRDATRRAQARENILSMTRAWVVTALALSVLVVVVSLLVIVLVSPVTAQAIGSLLAPVVSPVVALLDIVLAAIATVLLFLILNPLQWLHDHLFHPNQHAQPQPPANAGHAPRLTDHISASTLTVERWALLAVIVAVLLLLALRAMRHYNTFGRSDAFDEEREGLDARDILARRLRNLFSRGERPEALAESGPTLRPDGARALYREVLRAASHAGMARQVTETPEEYAGRLAPALDGVAQPAGVAAARESDAHAPLARLTAEYERARYGTPDGDEPAAPPETTQAQRRVLELLRAAGARTGEKTRRSK